MRIYHFLFWPVFPVGNCTDAGKQARKAAENSKTQKKLTINLK